MVTPEDINAELERSYDESPYNSGAIHNTHPLLMRTSAIIAGLDPAPVDRCRVLELGCAEGGNLIPLADAYADSEFVGIEFSSTQVDMARDRIARLGLANVDVLPLDILDISDAIGVFDYIICHGVYSWVPPEVQSKILDICRAHMAPNGVSLISFNTYPGWHFLDMIRDMMLEGTAGLATIQDRVVAGRELVRSLKDSLDASTNYGATLGEALQHVENLPDYMLAHDLLETVNMPLFVDEFIERIGEKELHGLVFDKPGRLHLRSSAGGDPVHNDARALKYWDYLNNTVFRTVTLCRKQDVVIDTGERAPYSGFHVASPMKATSDVDMFDTSEATFEADAGGIRSGSPAIKLALDYLGSIWPASSPVRDLALEVDTRLGSGSPFDSIERLETHLIDELSPLAARRSVEWTCDAYPFTTEVADRPRVSPWARLLAETGEAFCTRRHEMGGTDDTTRYLIPYLDGSRTLPEMATVVADAAAHGHLTLTTDDGIPLDYGHAAAFSLEVLLPRVLRGLARAALLVD